MPCATCMMLFKFARSQTILYTDLDLHADSSEIGTVTVDSLLKCELIRNLFCSRCSGLCAQVQVGIMSSS